MPFHRPMPTMPACPAQQCAHEVCHATLLRSRLHIACQVQSSSASLFLESELSTQFSQRSSPEFSPLPRADEGIISESPSSPAEVPMAGIETA